MVTDPKLAGESEPTGAYWHSETHRESESGMTKPTCAVWYIGDDEKKSATYELFDDEASAVKFAMEIEYEGYGSVSGIQFDDGRIFELADWKAYQEAAEERDESVREALREREYGPRTSTYCPLTGQLVEAKRPQPGEDPEELPSWLGDQD
jgi:hypothetical protein